MKRTEIIMGMPVTLEMVDADATADDGDAAFDYFRYVDETFSTYRETSEVMRMNRGELGADELSRDLRTVLDLCKETKRETHGFFDIRSPGGLLDPSGLVKGWAIQNVTEMLRARGRQNFYVDAGGDIAACGTNASGKPWRVGIRNPFDPTQQEIVKVILASDIGVATSGTSVRGEHIYHPFQKKPIRDIVSLTVIGPNVYEADRFATAAFAMGRQGIVFLTERKGLEGYMIDTAGQATMTMGFQNYVCVD